MPGSDPIGADAARSWTSQDAEDLARAFLRRVWSKPHDLDAIDELMTEDYVIVSGGTEIRGREAFKAWVASFQAQLLGATNEIEDVFASASGDRVVSRWTCRGRHNGLFGLPATHEDLAFTGIAIWRIRDRRLAECWVERAALEAWQRLNGAS
jgi:ketosteroid isomerase-like protein